MKGKTLTERERLAAELKAIDYGSWYRYVEDCMFLDSEKDHVDVLKSRLAQAKKDK